PGRKIYLGLDASLALGHPAVLILGLVMVPLTLLLALGLGALGVNRMLPFADLGLTSFLYDLVCGSSPGQSLSGPAYRHSHYGLNSYHWH
ncbi:PTS transporter subunit IIC, partial [Candidatus Hakubella thermalkaliphila]